MDEVKERIRDGRVKCTLDEYNKIRNKNYVIVEKLSVECAFASVYEVKDEHGRSIIMKAVDSTIHSIEATSEQVVKYLRIEIESMKQCKESPYVMDLIDAAEKAFDEDSYDYVFLLFMPKMQEATIYFRENGYKLPYILSMAKDVCCALEYVHSKKIIHRDIKPENIFYSCETKHFVLSDFGAARRILESDRVVTNIGTYHYIAPEIQQEMDLCGRMNCDIYSLGIAVLVLISRISESSTEVVEFLKSLHSDVYNVIMKAIDSDPEKRYQTARDFLSAIEGVEDKVSLECGNPQVFQKCVEAILSKEYMAAEKIAKRGHVNGIPAMSCLYAYLLASQKKISEALGILFPLVELENKVAIGLYGIISRLKVVNGDFVKNYESSPEKIKLIIQSANMGFSVAQYYIGRWLIDGEEGFSVDVETGTGYISASIQRGYLPAKFYFRKALKRHRDYFVSIESMVELIDIELEGFSKDDFPRETMLAIINSY